MKPVLKRLKVIVNCVIFFLIFFNNPVNPESRVWGNKTNPIKISSSSDIKIETRSNGEQLISLERQPYSLSYDEFLDSLSLSFDSGSQYVRSGDIIKSDYKSKSFPDSIGEVASFEQPLHELWVSPAEFLFLNNSTDTGDFSFYFRMRPYQIKRRMDIMQKLGLFEGRKQGVYCGWEGGKLNFKFYNFFWNTKGLPLDSITIQTRDQFLSNKFYPVLLIYKSSDGSLTLYLDGVEQEKIYLTSDFSPHGTRLIPRFHKWDRSPLIIGRNYLGAIDDVILSNRVLDPDNISGRYHRVVKNGGRFNQKPGVVISERIDFPVSRTGIERVKFETESPQGTDLKFFYRYSDTPFEASTSESVMPFRVLEEENLKDVQGKYFQWKARLFADADGQNTPVIKQLKIVYVLKKQPLAPAEISLLETKNEKVTIEFLRNMELDVVNGGRYHIYYGIKPYQPLGVIKFKSFENGNNGMIQGIPITNADKWVTDNQHYQNRIKITISNELISSNLAYFKQFPDLLYSYQVLQKDIPYYFWVTACDRYWSENIKNSDHESRPSPYIVVRIH